MTKLLRLVIAAALAVTLQQTAVSQSLSINTTGAVADPSAILDVTSTAKGLLIPRMDKAQKNAIATPANGLMVYQTGPDSIGFHYYDLPNTRWVFINTNGFATDTTAWKLNANNNVTDTSYLGSINNKPVRFKVNDTLSGIIDSTRGNTSLGYKSLLINNLAGFYANTAMGFGAGQNLTSGYGNTLMGRHTLSLTNVSIQNIAIGDSAMGRAISSFGNTAVGFQALKQHNGIGLYTYNTAIGYAAQSAATGTSNPYFNYYNTSVGGFSMANHVAGGYNTALGISALRNSDTSFYNTAIGADALFNHKKNNSNVAVGAFALRGDSAGYSNTAVGSEAMDLSKVGADNTAIGYRSLRENANGFANTAVGVGSLEKDSSGNYNTGVGRSALFFNRKGNYNTAIGFQAGTQADTAYEVTQIGTQAGYYNRVPYTTAVGTNALFANNFATLGNPTEGTENTGVGWSVMLSNVYGKQNTAMGFRALASTGFSSTGFPLSRNTAIGDSALNANRGNDNTSVGYLALSKNTTGNQHVAIGSRALVKTTATYPNTAIGYSSMDSTTTGFANTAVGSYSLTANKTGINNVAVGNAAMYQSTAGSNNTAVGNDAGRFFRNNDNTAIGSGALRNDSTGFGNTSTGAYSSFNITSAIWNTANGYFALENDTTGSENTAMGTSALRMNRNGIRNVGVGINSGFNVTSSNNAFLGSYAGEGAAGFSTGGANTGVGSFALTDIRSGGSNTAVGYQALSSDTSGNYNVAIGRNALFTNQASDYNTAVGYNSLLQHKRVGFTYNTGFGSFALEQDSSGFQNTGVGTSTFRFNKTGFYNTGVGINAGYYQKESYNTFIGAYSGVGERADLNYAADTGNYNTGLGVYSMWKIANGSHNVALGYNSLSEDSSGNNNTALGSQALLITTANGNTGLGYAAGDNNTTGTFNTLLGYNANVSLNNFTNATAIGANAYVGQSNSLILGSINGLNTATADTKVGIGTITPDSSLSVADNFLVGNSGTVQFANTVPVMNYMFKTGTINADRMVIAHSPSNPTWGLQYQDATDQFNFLGGGTNRMTIELGTGQVGIGTATPVTKLHIYEPNTANVNLRVASFNTSYEPGIELIKTGAGADWKIFNSTGNIFTLTRATDDFVAAPTDYYEWGVTAYRPAIDITNSLGLSTQRWTTVYASVGAINTSDARDKENINDLNYGLKEVMKLRPVSYTWKENPQWGKKIGFIAQEVQPVLGEVVQVGDIKSKTPEKDADGASAKPASDKLGIYYSDIIPVTVKAIQEQQQIIINQQKQIEELLKRVEKLEKKN